MNNMPHPHPLPCAKIERGQERLTPEQEAYTRHFAQERLAALLSPTSVDESKAEEHLRNAYRVAGLEPPRRMRWFDSPLAFVLAFIPTRVEATGRTSTQDSPQASVFDRVQARVRVSVGKDVWNRVCRSVGTDVQKRMPRVESGVRAALLHWSIWTSNDFASVWESLLALQWASNGDGEKTAVGIGVKASVRAYGGQSWHSVYRFFHEVFEPNDLIHLACLNEMISGYRFERQEAWMVRKPVRLESDKAGRLHAADGMCIQCHDGWGFYAWHGMLCSERAILYPEQLTKEDWLNARDWEEQQVIQERMPDFVEQVGARCIDVSTRGRLYEIDRGDRPEIHLDGDLEYGVSYVQIRDRSAERTSYFRVPSSIQSADEAVAWISLFKGIYSGYDWIDVS